MRQAGFARPLFDEASEYSHKWAGRLKEAVKDKIEVKEDLSGEEATRENVERTLKGNPDMDFVFYNHGTSEGLVQQGGEGYVIDKKNDHLLRGRVVYAMACSYGSDGAVHAWQQGAKIVVCYYEPYAFTPYDEELFCNGANSGYIAYANGEEDPKKIKQVMMQEYNNSIDKTNDPWSKMWLRRDRDAVRVYNAEEPTTTCGFRFVALRLFGRTGWYITRVRASALLVFGIGFGVTLHDFVSHLSELGGYEEILSPHGGYIGFVLMLIAFLTEFRDFIKTVNLLREQRNYG